MIKNLLIAGRVFLGIIFVFMGLNGLFHFIHLPPINERAMALINGLIHTGYLFQIQKITEVVCGALLILDLFVPLSLAVLAPIVLNIFLFHLFLEPRGLPLGILVLSLELFSVWGYRRSYAGIFSIKAIP